MKSRTTNNTIEDKIVRYSLITLLVIMLVFILAMLNTHYDKKLRDSFPPVDEASAYRSIEIDGQTILIPIR